MANNKILENKEQIAGLTSKLLTLCGEDVSREGLQETPKRVAIMYSEILSGYETDIDSIFKVFESASYSGIVTVTNIPFFSLCEHHVLPFFGKVHIGYRPKGKVLGLSKFARLVDAYSRRLQTQENITEQLAAILMQKLELDGCIVMIESRHLCMEMRGVSKSAPVTKTEVRKGIFDKDTSLINQFYIAVQNEK